MLLHVANGHCTTGLIELSGLPGRTQIWADPLNEGPVPGDVSDDELLLVRARFLASHPDDAGDVAADLKGWREAVDDEDAYDELVLWFEHDLFDQLNLIQLLAHIGSRPQLKPVTLICIDRYLGDPNFKGLGELEPHDIAALFETRRPVTAAQIALAARAWCAYRSPDPRAIEELLKTDTSALPFLARALARHLEEFPSETDGLSRSERRMLQQAIDGPAQLHAAFPRMHEGETAHYIADSWFFDRVTELSSASPALISLTVTSNGAHALPAGTIALTAAGRDVLSGKADRVKLCGIDRWLGGVHMQGHGRAWRWSAGAARLIQA
jgi:transposase